VAIAARRFGAGRALQLGYEDTWRWRMGGSDGVLRDRIWWAGLVSSVAYAPRVARESAETAIDEAPMAGLVASGGPGTSGSVTANLSGSQSDWIAWLFVLLALGLMGEIASRRLRGAS
jgi:hypothetical protein